MDDGIRTRVHSYALAVLLFALHLFVPASPLATAHVPERALSPPTGTGTGPPAGPAATTTAALGTLVLPSLPHPAPEERTARAAEPVPTHDHLRHRKPVEERIQALRARDRYRCEEHAPQQPLLPDPLGAVAVACPPPAADGPGTGLPSARLRPAERTVALQVFRC
ncbi:hypothetical protein ACWD6I_17625 [Streptomyces sp. NPDC002454]|uniref:hypothetical protein n=1 Tax=Streptomyces sp. NPDC002490 TaxID=3154416 RepID=UPI00332DE072